MIAGTGIDLVEVDRMEKAIAKKGGFAEKVFSKEEIRFCESTIEKYQHYAARFAAKEAFLKATGLGLMAGFDLHDIELVRDAVGKPSLVLHGDFKKLAEENNWNTIHVSLTHVQKMACAVVIIEQ